ncbi:hypothetical protein AAG906_038224 [Vitis piasezkii]
MAESRTPGDTEAGHFEPESDPYPHHPVQISHRRPLPILSPGGDRNSAFRHFPVPAVISGKAFCRDWEITLFEALSFCSIGFEVTIK